MLCRFVYQTVDVSLGFGNAAIAIVTYYSVPEEYAISILWGPDGRPPPL